MKSINFRRNFRFRAWHYYLIYLIHCLEWYHLTSQPLNCLIIHTIFSVGRINQISETFRYPWYPWYSVSTQISDNNVIIINVIIKCSIFILPISPIFRLSCKILLHTDNSVILYNLWSNYWYLNFRCKTYSYFTYAPDKLSRNFFLGIFANFNSVHFLCSQTSILHTYTDHLRV